MPFIGNTPDVNFTSFAKQDLTGVTGSPAKTGFTLTHAVANANEIEVFVNNVRQEPTESYTVSGTGLTMTGDVETTDDFYIIYLGKALQTTVPPDGSVGTAKIANSAVDLTSKVTGVLPVANGGTGVSTAMADQWRLTANTTAGANGDITANLERVDTAGQGFIGTGMTESSGIFSFPSTGIYMVMANATLTLNADNSGAVDTYVTIDNSSYTLLAQAIDGDRSTTNTIGSGSSVVFVNVTNTSNVKIKFVTSSMASSSQALGSSTYNNTYFTFLKLGA